MNRLRYLLLLAVFMVPASFLTGAETCPDCNALHPDVILQYEGNALSASKSCGPCHDVAFIQKNSSHYNDKVKADCMMCHNAGDLKAIGGGVLGKDRMRIFTPSNANCGRCHGITEHGGPVQVPDDYGSLFSYVEGKPFYRLTQRTGEIVSSQDISASMLNLANKSSLSYPWDTHARRNVTCASCHASPNSPRIAGRVTRVTMSADSGREVRYLVHDPRRASSLSRHLMKPSHKLEEPRCELCHDAARVHARLPYRNRHLSVLSCQSCHVPRLYGPAMRAMDATAVRPDGSPRVEYRGNLSPEETNLNVAYLGGYAPFLMAAAKQGGDHVLSPYNLVTTWKWVDRATGKDVPAETVRLAFGDGRDYHPEIRSLLDANKNGTVDPGELVLDTKEKLAAVRKALVSRGVADPSVKGTVSSYRVNHGIAERKVMTLACGDCHGASSRFGSKVELAAAAPFGALPAFAADGHAAVNGAIEREKASLVVDRMPSLKGHYVFGFSRVLWLDILGILLFMASFLAIAGHIFLRWRARKIFGPVHHEERVKIRRYRFYERLWHWSMALSVTLLMFTGFEIHYAGGSSILGLESAVTAHNVLAVLAVFNAVLSLFYHAATGEIRQFFRFGRSFGSELLAQVLFYVNGVFKRTHHPVMTGPERKYNPLQQLTYTALLNVLFPYQILTGVLMWAVGYFPSFGKAVGGLSIIAPLHNLGFWAFLTFFIIHVYLVTTGKHLWSFLEGMITGEMEEEDEEDSRQVREMLLALRPSDVIGTIRTLLGKKST